MKEIVVIFICSFDPFHKGLPCYHVDSVVRETGEIFNERVSAILVNGTYVGDDELGKLVNDFRVNNPDNMHYELLKEESRYYKETMEGIKHMCEIWEEERLEGRAEGRAEALKSSLKSLMETMHLSVEDAMNALKLTEEERQICRELL